MRRLIHVPILHTAADLGSLAESVKAQYSRMLGPAGWTWRQQTVEQLWRAIRGRIEALGLDHAKTRVYQDGLPVCGFELQIVQELAKAGSSNHQLLLDLIDRGATLTGTEDPQLLVREYQLHQPHARRTGDRSASAVASPEKGPADAEARHLLRARDQFIAKRIDATLKRGETGLLFLGAAHRLDAFPSTTIETETL